MGLLFPVSGLVLFSGLSQVGDGDEDSEREACDEDEDDAGAPGVLVKALDISGVVDEGVFGFVFEQGEFLVF